jgi:hypothetical protein
LLRNHGALIDVFGVLFPDVSAREEPETASELPKFDLYDDATSRAARGGTRTSRAAGTSRPPVARRLSSLASYASQVTNDDDDEGGAREILSILMSVDGTLSTVTLTDDGARDEHEVERAAERRRRR